MKTYAPDYYPYFACIAGECRHSCCIGWEIDVDADSLRRYQAMDGPLGDRLRQHIDTDGETACFRLQGAEERCPFLNADGLCDLIIGAGEDALCQICADHPRFRNFYQDRTEIGLGLCCEAAAALVLNWTQPMSLCVIEDDGTEEEPDADELALLSTRDRLIRLMQDRSLPVAQRFVCLLAEAGVSVADFDWSVWIPFLLDLEMLDSRWGELLAPVAQAAAELPDLQQPTAMEQWMVYLLYRHLPAAMDDGDLRGHLLLCALLWLLIAHLCAICGETLPELCRLCSSELEYSEDNIAAILEEVACRFDC